MPNAKHKFNIIAKTKTGQVKTLYKGVDAVKLIPTLLEQKNFIDDNFNEISVERQTDGFTIVLKTNNNWVERVAKTFKLGRTRNSENTHSYTVEFAVFKKKLDADLHIEFTQETVLNSTDNFKKCICEKMFDKQTGLRVAVIRVVDVATNTQEDKKYKVVYSHAFYPSTITGTPDLAGTGVRVRHGTHSERTTRVVFNHKKHTITGGEISYFGNQPDVILALDEIINFVRAHNVRKIKQNEK